MKGQEQRTLRMKSTVLTYDTAITIIMERWDVAIRPARFLLGGARNGNPIILGENVLYYRSDKKYELINEGKI